MSTNATMSMPTYGEVIIPPLACLFLVGLGLVVYILVFRHLSKRKSLRYSSFGKRSSLINNPEGNSFLGGNNNNNNNKSNNNINNSKTKIAPSSGKVGGGEHMVTKRPLPGSSSCIFSADEEDLTSTRRLFEDDDMPLINVLHGVTPVSVRQLLGIMMPVIFSLGFAPILLLLKMPMLDLLWPPSEFAMAPNINDAIACYLVPAGMVYAITFGFAFQIATDAFRETALTVEKHAARGRKLLSLVTQLEGVPMATRVSMLRLTKHLVMTSASRLLGHKTRHERLPEEDLDRFLRILYTVEGKSDKWQTSVYERLEAILAEDEVFTEKYRKTYVHVLQWIFLETLGFMTFLGILLVENFSYRANLGMCLITVISISLLCYIVSDLDAPFYGVFQIDLKSFAEVISKLDIAFYRLTESAVMISDP